MNLDSLSLALSQISYLVDNLTKKNYRASQQEIQHVSFLLHTLISGLLQPFFFSLSLSSLHEVNTKITQNLTSFQ